MQYGSLIVGGDLNLIADPALDTTTAKPSRPAPLHHLLHTQELFDAWRYLNADDYTFFSTRHCSYSRTDMFLVDQWLLQHICAAQIHDITWSDHAAISLSIAEQGVSSLPPIW